MCDFKQGLLVACIVEFTEAFDFRKFDVPLDSINLKSSLETNREVDKIKDELSNFLPYKQLKSNKSPINFYLDYPDDCLGIVSFNNRNYIDTELLHEYFMEENALKAYYSALIKKWISDTEIIKNEIQLIPKLITKNI